MKTSIIAAAITLAFLSACGGGGGDETVPATDSASAPAVAPDLIFTPSDVALVPGAQTNVQVQVDTGADLQGASFTFAGMQGGVTTSFEAAPDGKSGTLTLVANQATEAGDQRLAVEGKSGVDAEKAWVGNLRVITAASPTAKTYFVDPAGGNDTADGSQNLPLKTLRQALQRARSGDIVKLGAGQYTRKVNGEVYPLTVPAGVLFQGTLAANGAKLSALSPLTSAEQATGLVFAGDATVKDLEMDVFGLALDASSGKQSYSNVLLVFNTMSVLARGAAESTLVNSNVLLAPKPSVMAVSVRQQATFTMDGGLVETTGPNCEIGVSGVSASESAAVTLKSAGFTNIAGPAVDLQGGSKGTLGIRATRTLASACRPLPSVRSSGPILIIAPTSKIFSVGGTNSVGIDKVGEGLLSIDAASIDGGEISGGTASIGIRVDQRAKLVMTRSHILGARVGLEAFFNEQGLSISDSIFQLNQTAIDTTTGLRLRNTVFDGYTRAVNFFGSNVSADLGTSADPGKNNFANGATFNPGSIIGVNLGSASSGLVNAAGNTWTAATQFSNINGQYPPHLEVGRTSPQFDNKKKNFFLPNASTQIQF